MLAEGANYCLDCLLKISLDRRNIELRQSPVSQHGWRTREEQQLLNLPEQREWEDLSLC